MINRIFQRIKNFIMNLKISVKIMLFYFILLIFSISTSSFLYQNIHSSIMSDKVSDVSIQNLYSIKSNIEATINNVNNYSKVILSSDDVQNSLRNSNIDLDTQRKVNTYLLKLIDAIPQISSVYVFDNFGNKYAVDKLTTKNWILDNVKKAIWYNDVVEKKGGYILKLNAGGVFGKICDKNFVSLIRVINDLNSQKPIGILFVNILEDSFRYSYEDMKYNTDLILLDEEDEYIINGKNIKNLDLEKIINNAEEKNSYSTVMKIEGREYLISYLKMDIFNWKIISIMPFNELSRESSIFSLIAFVVILVNGLLIFIGSTLIARLITTPIKNLLRSMKDVENGRFEKVDVKTGNDEIGKLRDGYNIMISQIQKLIDKLLEEQKVKRKAELYALQAQIKPHFLYNTFDAISSLALMGRTQEVYDIMMALGSFYRTSLSKGKEIITIAEELEMVKNYLKIQKYRYNDMFSVTFDIDERVIKFKILKLVLQPLVENALYHGIKPKGANGHIYVAAKINQDFVKLIVEDNGVGMSEEEINNVLTRNEKNDCSSFGIKGTVERLRIFYGTKDVIEIESKKWHGTKVTITVPMVEEEREDVR
ncbi:MAG TPA: sensor histidine kinase [Clostridiaceae bacterium]|nr:sensor histidine kinase [Clostridiaceae bacterium]